MEIVYILIGVLVGGIVVYLIVLNQKKGVEGRLALSDQQLQQTVERSAELQQRLADSEQRLSELSELNTNLKAELSSLSTSLQNEKEKNSSEAALRQQQFQQQLQTVQEKFTNLAAEVLEKTQEKLKNGNQESMATLTAPLHENIGKLQEAIDKTNRQTAQSTASLAEQLKQMADRTDKIDQTATRLTNVMRGGNQEQGSWGERILTDILQMAGLTEGVDYDVQVILRDENGKPLVNADTGSQMKPDVVLHYPNNEDVIVDSKMSISAYYQYVNTDDALQKKQAADLLVKNVKAHVTGLAKKNYSDYVLPPRKTIDFVIMFLPNDGALQLALQTDKNLWSWAFEQSVFITGQQNLMGILRMIQMAWRQHQQTINQQKVFLLADELMKRVGEFYERFQKMGGQIDALQKAYDEVGKKATRGRQSILQKANQLKALGAKEDSKHPLPEMMDDVELLTASDVQEEPLS